MGEPWFPDPARSRAVLIGVGKYRSMELPAIPAVRDNVRDLHAALTDPAGGTLPDNGCVRLGDDSDHARVGTAVATAAAQARDLLLVYYAGHGVLDRDDKLHLSKNRPTVRRTPIPPRKNGPPHARNSNHPSPPRCPAPPRSQPRQPS